MPFNVHDDTYHAMLRHILEHGDKHADRTGVGTTSVFGYQNRYDLGQGFPMLTTKRVFIRGLVEELRWFLLGRTDLAWLQARKVGIWDEWGTKEQCAKFGRAEGDLGPIYGKQWRNFGFVEEVAGGDGRNGVDQIRQLCDDLQNNPRSRRLIVSGWNPAEATTVALPPCHTMFHCKVREVTEMIDPDNGSPEFAATTRFLDLQLYQRSADAFLGIPFNIASYALLTHLLATVSDMEPGRFIHTFGDLHIYNNHREQVNEQLGRESRLTPTIMVHPKYRGRGFEGLMEWAAGKDMEGLQLVGYDPHPPIKAEVAV